MRKRPYLWQLFVLFLCLIVCVCTGAYVHARENAGPQIKAEVVGQKTKEHRIRPEKISTVIETVRYRNLVPGLKYMVCGRLVERAGGEPLKIGQTEVTNSVSFTPASSEGKVKIPFTFDARPFAGREAVLLDEICCNGTRILSAGGAEDEARAFWILEDP